MKPNKEKLRRERHLTIRLSDEERIALDEASERAGLMCGSYARQVLFGAPQPRQVRRPPVERRELARLLAELGHIGSNLNQLAKAANTGVVVYEGEIASSVRAVLEMRDALLHALGRAS